MNQTVDPATGAAIEWLIHEHAWLIDHGRAGELPSLYAEDGRVLGIGPDKVGREAIGVWASQREAMTERRSRHVQSAIRLRPVKPGQVSGTVVLTLYRHDGPGRAEPVPFLVGEYDDEYQRGEDGTWRFAERRLTVLFGG